MSPAVQAAVGVVLEGATYRIGRRVLEVVELLQHGRRDVASVPGVVQDEHQPVAEDRIQRCGVRSVVAVQQGVEAGERQRTTGSGLVNRLLEHFHDVVPGWCEPGSDPVVGRHYPRTGDHGMGVGVDESGHQGRRAGVDDSRLGQRCLTFGEGADGDDAVVGHGDGFGPGPGGAHGDHGVGGENAIHAGDVIDPRGDEPQKWSVATTATGTVLIARGA